MWRACSFAIEDFVSGDNRDAFTTEYMWKIQGIVSSINSRLKLEAVAYYSGGAVDDGFCEKYAPYIDGVVFPRPDEPHHNVLRGSTLAQQLDAVTPCTEKHHIDANLLLYTGRYGTFDAPEAGYVQVALSVSSEINYRSRSTPLSCEMSAGMSASFDTTFATLPRASGAVAKLPGSMSEAVGVCAGLDDGAAEGESVDDGGA